MMTELANKIRRIPPKNTDCMLIQVRNIRYQGRSILGARTGGTPPAKPGSPRVNFPTVMGSIVSVVWARHLGGTRHPRVLLASRSHFSALGVSNVKLRTMAAVINFLSVRYRPLARLSRTSPPSRPPAAPPRRVVDAISLGARASDASPTRRQASRPTHARPARDAPSTDLPTYSSPSSPSARAAGGALSSPSPRAARSTSSPPMASRRQRRRSLQPSTPPSRRTTSRSPPAPPTSSSPPPPSPPP